MNTFIQKKIDYRDLSVDPDLTAPLLGYEETLPADIRAIVEEVMDETSGCYDIRGGYRIFDGIHFNEDKTHIRVGDIDFTTGKTIYHQLKRSEQIAVFVCTAGADIEKWSKQMMANNDPLKGFIADILGGVVVELAIDLIQHELSENQNGKGLKITNRYSPGYCGWATEEQRKLFSALPPGNCGIRLTESSLMQPVKSVSGFIGIGADVRFNPYTCGLCEATHCVYRNKRKSAN